jgi:hypothetical protein
MPMSAVLAVSFGGDSNLSAFDQYSTTGILLSAKSHGTELLLNTFAFACEASAAVI